tara:strand:+ start:690 stop:1415 length:726 start_codon:yes stop_codon:yes gene_type:complete
MLSLGSSLSRPSISKKSIVKDNLALMHDYTNHGIHQVSTGAAFFDNSNTDYITMGDVCDLGTTDFTISYWVYLTVAGSQFIMGKRQGSNDYWFFGTNSGGGPRFLSTVGGSTAQDLSVSGGDPVPLRTWTHIAASFDRDGLEKIYINGVERASDSCNATDIDNTGDLTLGSFYAGANHMDDGYLCNVGIWSGKALSQAEIKSIMWKNYTDLTSAETTSLASWWNLSENANDNHGSNNGTLS